jgi:hypothetical protein
MQPGKDGGDGDSIFVTLGRHANRADDFPAIQSLCRALHDE